MALGCDECGAAGRLLQSMELPFTDGELEAIMAARDAIKAAGLEINKELLMRTLHERCKAGRRCTCQHGRYWEQDPDEKSGVPAYLDALPADHPAVLEYEEAVGRKIQR